MLNGALFAREPFQFNWNPYATHQPVLYKIAKMTTGPIVVDHDEEWLGRYANKYLGDGYSADNSGWHKFILVPKHDGNTSLEDWILFLDQ